MHISIEIQSRLHKYNSNIELDFSDSIHGMNNRNTNASCGTEKYGRNFIAGFAKSNNDFYIILFENKRKYIYIDCFARAYITDLEKLVHIIYLWVDKEIKISEIKELHNGIELFEEFNFRNSNNEINEAWRKIKNIFFFDDEFWNYTEWKSRYLELLIKANKHKILRNYYPTTSHQRLKFHLTKDCIERWSHDLFILPFWQEDNSINLKYKYFVSYSDIIFEQFETVNEGLNFLSRKILELSADKTIL